MHVCLIIVNWKTVASVRLIQRNVKNVSLDLFLTFPLVDALKLRLRIVLVLESLKMELNAGIVIQVSKSTTRPGNLVKESVLILTVLIAPIAQVSVKSVLMVMDSEMFHRLKTSVLKFQLICLTV